VWTEFWLSPHPNSGAFCSFPAFTSSRFYQFALKFREATQYCQHQPTTRSGCVTPRVSDGFKKTPEGFAAGVTRSNNTQNDLNASDFVAFDPNQERLRREAISLGIAYAFRRGEPDPPAGSGFNIRAATVAAACASGDLKLAVSAKRYISGLWDDIKKEPYTKLFNDSTTATYLWNIVQLMNAVDAKLGEQAESLEGRERLIAVHGNRFILFRVFSQINLDDLKNESFDLEPVKVKCQQLALDTLKATIPAINKKFPDAYPGNIFKNQDRQGELLTAISK
jgi:hypothetical protein